MHDQIKKRLLDQHVFERESIFVCSLELKSFDSIELFASLFNKHINVVVQCVAFARTLSRNNQCSLWIIITKTKKFRNMNWNCFAVISLHLPSTIDFALLLTWQYLDGLSIPAALARQFRVASKWRRRHRSKSHGPSSGRRTGRDSVGRWPCTRSHKRLQINNGSILTVIIKELRFDIEMRGNTGADSLSITFLGLGGDLYRPKILTCANLLQLLVIVAGHCDIHNQFHAISRYSAV